jgi:predicted metalloendopeptidase
MRRCLRIFAIGGIGCCLSPAIPAAASGTPLKSGVVLENIDPTVRPQDDFFRYANGRWLAATDIPADRASFGVSEMIYDTILAQLRDLIERLPRGAAGEAQQIADFYASFMDEAGIDSRGLEPIAAELGRIDSVRGAADLAALIGRYQRLGIVVPIAAQVHQDARDSTRSVFDLEQDGLGLPDRDYYLSAEAEFKRVRPLYLAHAEAMLTLTGDTDAARDARAVMGLETSIARLQWTKVALRDPVKAYNPVPIANLAAMAPEFDWQAYLAAADVDGRTPYIVIGQPGYLRGFARLLKSVPLPAWRAYFRWHLVCDYAPYLASRLAAEHFAFYGTALRGIDHERDRWRRGVELVDGSIGEALGKLYVAQHFPPEAKARATRMVDNLLAAYAADIRTLDWMSPATRVRAAEKLAKLRVKIGYPDHWRDYSTLVVERGDLAGNVMRAHEFEYDRYLGKLGRPVDHTEWDMTPPTVNAYYDPERNEIVFPAGILQPPFFDPDADDAANYGATGQTIGHEISHAFDDWGSQYDGEGRLLTPPGWFTWKDLARFKQKTRALVAQYSEYAPVPGFPINGELTLGENIADNAGLAVAYKAYVLSLGGHAAPVIDGFTGAQRFFLGYAQSYLGKSRDSEAIMAIKADPHSPDRFRGTLPEMNLAAFDEAFDVKPGDPMYRPPDRRIVLW